MIRVKTSLFPFIIVHLLAGRGNALQTCGDFCKDLEDACKCLIQIFRIIELKTFVLGHLMFVHLSPDFLVSNFVGKWIFCTSMRPSTSSMKNYYYLAVLDALCTKLKRHGIGFVVAPRMAPNLLKVKAHSDRIGVATFRGEGDTAVHIVNVLFTS